MADTEHTKTEQRWLGRLDDLVRVRTESRMARTWLAEGAIEVEPTAPVVLFVGPEKQGKSWTLMDLCVSVSQGGKWLGRFATAERSVLYLDAEMGQYEFVRRLDRLARGRGLDPDEVAGAIDYRYSAALRLRADNPDFDAILEDLRRLRKEDSPLCPALIVVDPFRNVLEGNENAAQDVIEAFRCVVALRNATGAAVIVAHHVNKQGGYSGSRAMLGRADLIIEGSDEEPPWYKAKGRTLRSTDPIATSFTIGIEHEHDEDDEQARTVLTSRLSGESHANRGLSKSALCVLDGLRDAKVPQSINQIKTAVRRSHKVVKGALNELKDGGLAGPRGDKWALSTDEFFDVLGGDS